MKKLVMLGLLLCTSVGLVGCADSNSKYVTEDNRKLVNISGVLSYDIDTRIIYYYFKDSTGNTGFGYMSPYISENGYFCKYDVNEKKIIELEK